MGAEEMFPLPLASVQPSNDDALLLWNVGAGTATPAQLMPSAAMLFQNSLTPLQPEMPTPAPVFPLKVLFTRVAPLGFWRSKPGPVLSTTTFWAMTPSNPLTDHMPPALLRMTLS